MRLEIFKYQSDEEQSLNEIRTIEINGEIWFVGVDVANVLGYSKPNNAINTHCKEKGTLKQGIPTKGGKQEMILINEPNVYRLIVRSKLASAEKFEEWLFDEVLPSIRKKGFYGKIDKTELPEFMKRYRENYHKIPKDHFSVISEMFVRLYIELEKVGYQIPDKGTDGKDMMPDISVGKGFAAYLKANESHFYNTHESYTHSFPDGRKVLANMYHVDALPLFIRYINETWMFENAQKYFKERDPVALGYLPKILGNGKNK